MADDRKKKIAIAGVCSLILVAMVVALTIGTRDDESKEVKDVASSQKAITSICQSTDYKEACFESLKDTSNDTSDPKRIIETAFQSAIKYIELAVQNSTVGKAVQNDPRSQVALGECKELAIRAVNDLKRSYTKFNDFDVINFSEMLADMKIWLSGALTYQDTCLDGFEGVNSDAGAKMRAALTKAMQMTSNGLAMVTEIANYLESMGVQNVTSRRLLELPVLGHGDELPDWIDGNRRRLLSSNSVKKVKPHVVVAKDGSGKYTTITEALREVPDDNEKIFVIYIKEGIYDEKVTVNSSMKHVMFLGDGPTKTTITGKLSIKDGIGTYHTASVVIAGDYFIAKDIGFENSAGAIKEQAVALRVSADKVIFYNCQMDGYQDTLYAHTYRQYYRNCVISGTVDFIFGDSAALFQNCTLLFRKPLADQRNIVTAQGRRDIRQPTGFVLQNCSFVATPDYFPLRFQMPSFLARPWKEYSRTIFLESYISDVINPEGYLPWNGDFALSTLFYTEFNNRGPGANKNLRLKWPGIKELPASRIKRFLGNEFIDGKKWIKNTKVPFEGGFIFPVPEENPHITYSPVVPEENKDLGDNKHNKKRDKSDYVFKASPPAADTAAPEPASSHHKKSSHSKGKDSDHHKKSKDSETADAPAPSHEKSHHKKDKDSETTKHEDDHNEKTTEAEMIVTAAPTPAISEIAAAPSQSALSPAGLPPTEAEQPIIKSKHQGGGFSLYNFRA
jgi:pectinesterase